MSHQDLVSGIESSVDLHDRYVARHRFQTERRGSPSGSRPCAARRPPGSNPAGDAKAPCTNTIVGPDAAARALVEKTEIESIRAAAMRAPIPEHAGRLHAQVVEFLVEVHGGSPFRADAPPSRTRRHGPGGSPILTVIGSPVGRARQGHWFVYGARALYPGLWSRGPPARRRRLRRARYSGTLDTGDRRAGRRSRAPRGRSDVRASR